MRNGGGLLVNRKKNKPHSSPLLRMVCQGLFFVLTLTSVRKVYWTLLALVAVLSQSLLTLVSRDLVSFLLLTVWHCC